MKNFKKWILFAGLAGQTFLPVSCSGTFTRQIREALINGVTTYLQTTTSAALTQFIPFP